MIPHILWSMMEIIFSAFKVAIEMRVTSSDSGIGNYILLFVKSRDIILKTRKGRSGAQVN